MGCSPGKKTKLCCVGVSVGCLPSAQSKTPSLALDPCMHVRRWIRLPYFALLYMYKGRKKTPFDIISCPMLMTVVSVAGPSVMVERSSTNPGVCLRPNDPEPRSAKRDAALRVLQNPFPLTRRLCLPKPRKPHNRITSESVMLLMDASYLLFNPTLPCLTLINLLDVMQLRTCFRIRYPHAVQSD
ncbi:hypothetical protein B0O99DRAFT_609742 [Bisporella sp. PMI_857]|nr:hypothetical protein B0O99DRAFT_609742 [Bisporella sp. PMI_857]